jgi:hypothetical protein
MGRRVDYRPEGHRVGDLPVEPDVLVDRDEVGQRRTENTDYVAQQRDEDQASVESENKTGTARDPHRVFEGIKSRKSFICMLILL